VVVTPLKLIDALVPELSREEELYAISLVDLVSSALGKDAGVLVAGDAFLDPQAVGRLALGVLTSGTKYSCDIIYIQKCTMC
jgi:aarF domain-containing kinase